MTNKAKCQNCEMVHEVDNLERISHYAERVMPGEVAPAGQCPDCGALCSIEDEEIPQYVLDSYVEVLRKRGYQVRPPE